jgi:hypothetical protein
LLFDSAPMNRELNRPTTVRIGNPCDRYLH